MMNSTQTIALNGKRYVIIEEAEYEKMYNSFSKPLDKDDLPAFPKPDKDGRYPALEYTRISLARNLIRDRKAAGLSQQQLADLSGVRTETISRLESGKHTASTKTLNKLDKAITKINTH